MTSEQTETRTPLHLMARREATSRWWLSLAELAMFLVVFVLLFVGVTEGLHAILGPRADNWLNYGSMAVALVALPAAVRWGGRRPVSQLLGSTRRFDWPAFLRSGLLTLTALPVALVVGALLTWARPTPASSSAATWVAGAITIPLGAFAEELIFRAWLPQVLGRWLSSPLAVFGLTVPLFAAIHEPSTVQQWCNHLVAGACFAALAWASDGLALPTGMHATSNLVLAASSGLDPALSQNHSTPMLTAKSIALVLVTAALVRRYRSRPSAE